MPMGGPSLRRGGLTGRGGRDLAGGELSGLTPARPPARPPAVAVAGNGDDLSLHAGEPVVRGRKWVCNLWIWDPKRGKM